jgi:hypothetical protein
MKNLFNPTVKEEILSRVNKLTPTTKAQWGKMNVNQSLRHLAMCFDISTGKLDPTPVKAPALPKWLFKLILLNAKPPKEKAETYQETNTVANNINPTDFEVERENFTKALEDFLSCDSLVAENKLGGNFNRDDWGKLNYNHIDHHLRQFGV